MIAGDTWFVQVDETIYGPYTTGQMNGYIAEGRVIANSWVTTNPSLPFRNAHDFENFMPAFTLNSPAAQTERQPSRSETLLEPSVPLNLAPRETYSPKQTVSSKTNTFGLNIYELSTPLEQSSLTQNTPYTPQTSPIHPDQNKAQLAGAETLLDATLEETRNVEGVQQPDETVVLIMAELKTEQTMGFLKALQLCGIAERISHSVWLIRTPLSATALRNRLSHTISDTDRLFIMDSYNGQTAWFNIGSDMDARIRKLWSE